jgi:hypothetical protein
MRIRRTHYARPEITSWHVPLKPIPGRPGCWLRPAFPDPVAYPATLTFGRDYYLGRCDECGDIALLTTDRAAERWQRSHSHSELTDD